MHANVGDEVLIHTRAVGIPEHTGTVIEVRGGDGAPPYVIRFDDGHETLIYPGPDCVVRPH